MRTIVWFAYFWSYLVCLLPQMYKAKRLRAKGDKAYEAIVDKAVSTWARRLMRLAGAKVSVYGIENIPKGEPVVFMGNHSGYFDIPLFLAYLDKTHAIIAKKEISKLPLIRTWMGLFDCIFIDRANPRQSVQGLNTAAELVKAGKCVSIFPEGTRAKGKEIAEFKSGGFKVATKTKARIVPIAIVGTHLLMEANHYFIHPAKITMSILPPIATDGLSKEEQKALPDKVQQIVAKEHTRIQNV